ncbi:hypothetical protein [Methanobacterium oryzae]|uniref:hypothetical protein n=1 Tax=Methanobacterium oryzae TaxID=69540 RepID=UPI003D22F23F
MIGKTVILGANLMKISSTMIFKTNVFSIPWRRNILTGLWLLGFGFFWIGLKMKENV